MKHYVMGPKLYSKFVLEINDKLKFKSSKDGVSKDDVSITFDEGDLKIRIHCNKFFPKDDGATMWDVTAVYNEMREDFKKGSLRWQKDLFGEQKDQRQIP